MIELDVSVDLPAWEETCPDYQSLVTRAINATFENSPIAVNIMEMGAEPEISVVLTDNIAVHALNHQYREKDKPTNILSFAMLDGENGWAAPDAPGPCALGDLVLAYETVLAEAELEGKPFAEHFTHLIVHGTLHLLGYDHIDDEEAETMESLEIQILSGFGLQDPYKNR